MGAAAGRVNTARQPGVLRPAFERRSPWHSRPFPPAPDASSTPRPDLCVHLHKALRAFLTDTLA